MYSFAMHEEGIQTHSSFKLIHLTKDIIVTIVDNSDETPFDNIEVRTCAMQDNAQMRIPAHPKPYLSIMLEI